MAKRNGNGEGTRPRRRPDGRWEVRYWNGETRRSIYGQTRLEVSRKLAAVFACIEDAPGDVETTRAEDRLTFREFLVQYSGAARHTMKQRSFETYEEIARLHLLPDLGDVLLAELSRQRVQRLYNLKVESGLSAARVRRIHGVLNAALSTAVKWRLVEHNVCREVSAPRVEEPEIRPLSVDEARRFLKAAEKDRMYALYVLGVTTGMRLGELCGLQWLDVDFEGQTIRVCRALISGKGTPRLDTPKTPKSRRNIHLGTIALEAVRVHRERQSTEGIATGGRDQIFTNTRGGFVNRSHLTSRSFKRLLEKATLPDTTFHAATRHTCCSILLSRGVNVKAVSLQLGHSSVAFTLQKYAHLLPGFSNGGAMDDALWEDAPRSGHDSA